MDKSPDAFRTISEVADWLGVQAHVLRFWESKFTQVKPVKRAGGRRYYRPSDMRLLGGIKKLLHDDGLTIKGVQKSLREQGVTRIADLSPELDETGDENGLKGVVDARVLPFKGIPAQPDEIEPTPAAPVDKAAPDPVDEPEEITADPVSADPPAPVEEQPILPSFLHRPLQKAPAKAPEPAPEPVADEVAPSLVVDAPDPPNETDMPYGRGALTHLAGLDKLSTEQAAKIAPLAEELHAWLARTAA